MHHTKNKKSHWVIEAVGWLGAAAVLLAYALTLFGVIDGNGFWNAFLNLAGAVGLIVIAASKKVAQSVVLNLVWAVIALVAIVGIWLK